MMENSTQQGGTLEPGTSKQKFPLMQHLKWALWSGVIIGLLGLILFQDSWGGIVFTFIGLGFGWHVAPDLYQFALQYVELPALFRRFLPPRHRQIAEASVVTPTTTVMAEPIHTTTILAPPVSEETPEPSQENVQREEPDDDLFSDIVPNQKPPFPRINQSEVIAHSHENDFTVVVGQSVKKEPRRAKRIRFRKRHMKCIGASQFGKSTNAAYLLDTIFKTHDPNHVQVAILDMEDRTGQIFEDDHHVATILKNGQLLRLHARTIPEVFDHLGYLYTLVEQRYKLSLEEQEKLPLLIVYFEEFLAFKDELKNAMYRGPSEEREQAKRNFATFMNRFKHIAQRGLKVYVQLLVCAQVEYRDEDLVEAFANIVHGFAFCVKPTAAQAAGFFQGDLLADNAKAKLQGQCVCEMPEMNDIILVPQFDIDERIRAMQKKRKTTSFLAEIYDDDGILPIGARLTMMGIEEEQTEEETPASGIKPALSPKLQLALSLYKSGKTTINDLATAMTIDGRYGKTGPTEAYNLLGLLDEMGYIVRNRKMKMEV